MCTRTLWCWRWGCSVLLWPARTRVLSPHPLHPPTPTHAHPHVAPLLLQVYVRYRNFMVDMYHSKPGVYLTATAVRKLWCVPGNRSVGGHVDALVLFPPRSEPLSCGLLLRPPPPRPPPLPMSRCVSGWPGQRGGRGRHRARASVLGALAPHQLRLARVSTLLHPNHVCAAPHTGTHARTPFPPPPRPNANSSPPACLVAPGHVPVSQPCLCVPAFEV
jgi:hypothetical protein